MLQVTDKQLENLMYLRDVVIPWMREHPERVDLDVWDSDCGTFACLIGHYSRMRHGVRIDQVDEIHEFGLREGEIITLFGSSKFGPLEDRAALLDEIIAERLARLEAA